MAGRHGIRAVFVKGGRMGQRTNMWGERQHYSIKIKGQRETSKEITTRLVEGYFDVSYAYGPLSHPGLGHAFLNSVLYLHNDRPASGGR